MQEAHVICDFLFPAGQEPPRPVDPGVRALHFPATGFPLTTLRLRFLSAFGRDVGYVTTPAHFTFNGLASVSFVQAKMLWFSRRGFRTWNRNIIERGRQQFLVMHIGAVDRGSKRDATTVDQHRAFDAELATIGRVFPGFFPHPAAICSSPHPHSATSSRSPSGHRILPRPRATVHRTHQAQPTPGSRRGSRFPSRTRSASPSTGTRSSRHTESHPRHSAKATADARLCNSDCKLGAKDQSVAREHRKPGETLTRNQRPLAHLHAKLRTLPLKSQLACQ